jgi:hypothetical protein
LVLLFGSHFLQFGRQSDTLGPEEGGKVSELDLPGAAPYALGSESFLRNPAHYRLAGFTEEGGRLARC